MCAGVDRPGTMSWRATGQAIVIIPVAVLSPFARRFVDGSPKVWSPACLGPDEEGRVLIRHLTLTVRVGNVLRC